MSTLAEIEAATEALSAQVREALFHFLAARLGAPIASLPEKQRVPDGKRFDAAVHRAWLERTWGDRQFTEDDMREMRVAQERGRE